MSKDRFNALVAFAVLAVIASAAGIASAQSQELVVYTYDSFLSWGPGESIEDGFESLHPDVDVIFVAPGDSGDTLARIIQEMETGETDADVFVGVSDTQLPRALARNAFLKLDLDKLKNLAHVPDELLFDETGHVVPFDHGYVTFVYDRERLSQEDLPASLEDLTDPRFRNKIIVIDPRTSSVGHAFLMWTIAKFGDPGYLDFWRALLPNLLTISGGWTAAYTQFEEGEAPIVLSYTTDTAYSVMYSEHDRYRVLTPEGEAYHQIEAMGIVADTDVPDLAHEFLDYVLSVEVQEQIPTTNWMFPANAATPLPEVWNEYAVVPDRPVWIAPDEIAEHESRWLREWASVIVR